MKPRNRLLYNLLRKIPRNKVTTYGILAKNLKTSPRAVGKMLNANAYPDKYPCYKVVMSNRKLGGYSHGTKEKIRRLRKNGTKLTDGKRVDFEKTLYKFKQNKNKKKNKK